MSRRKTPPPGKQQLEHPCTCRKPVRSGAIMCRRHRVYVPAPWPEGAVDAEWSTTLTDMRDSRS